MTGTEDFHADDWDLADVLWRPGVDYVGQWRVARDCAELLMSAFALCGLDDGSARAVAVSGSDGAASVTVHLSADAARLLADVLAQGRAAA